MPLPKRVIEPVHVARGTIPENFPLPSELEAVTNGTLANTVRQLSSLSKHAEDLFGELARDAQQLHDRSNSLQARIDRLAVKVTQLDSTVEEVSLQDIHMRKAFKSAVVFDQQIFSRDTMPTAMLATYKSCDKPPPLDKLNVYRDDGKDGLKFYTDPNYFFELWRQGMHKETERVMHERGKKPHRPRSAGSDAAAQGARHKKRVRQPHNTRERQRQIAMGHGEYIMPSTVIYNRPQVQQENSLEQRPPRPNSIELRRSYSHEVPDGIQSPPYPPYEDNPYQHGMYGQGPLSSESLYQQQQSNAGTPTRGLKARPSQPPPAPPSNATTPSANTPTRSTANNRRDALPPPPPPPEATSMSPPPPPLNGIPPHVLSERRSSSRSNSPAPVEQQELPPPPLPAAMVAMGKQQSPPKQVVQTAPPPPPPPPPMPVEVNRGSPAKMMVNGDVGKNAVASSPPIAAMVSVKERIVVAAGGIKVVPPAMDDPRNDLLKAIRDGIKLRKVEKIEQKEVERGNGLHDVASILRRRVAVEFSDSDSESESEYDSEGWGENETSA